MKQNRKKTTKQGRSIFQTILSTILLTLCAEVLLLAGAFYFIMNWVVSAVFLSIEKKLDYYK